MCSCSSGHELQVRENPISRRIGDSPPPCSLPVYQPRRYGGADLLYQQHRPCCRFLRGRGARRLGVVAQLPAPVAKVTADYGQVHLPHGQVSGSAFVWQLPTVSCWRLEREHDE